MARYHFTLSDSTISLDPEGTELESLATAQNEAIIYAAESLKGAVEFGSWPTGRWRCA